MRWVVMTVVRATSPRPATISARCHRATVLEDGFEEDHGEESRQAAVMVRGWCRFFEAWARGGGEANGGDDEIGCVQARYIMECARSLVPGIMEYARDLAVGIMEYAHRRGMIVMLGGRALPYQRMHIPTGLPCP